MLVRHVPIYVIRCVRYECLTRSHRASWPGVLTAAIKGLHGQSRMEGAAGEPEGMNE